MSAHSDRAAELFKQGFNCSQAVFAAFCDEFDMDEKTALKVSAGLGGGVGRLREVCGTVTGASMVAGMLYGATDGSDHEKKALTYQKVQQIVDEFKKLNPSIVCRELLGLSPTASTPSTPEHRTDEFYKKRPCAQLVEDSAKAVDKILFGIED